MGRWVLPFVAVAAVVAALLGLLWLGQRRLMYFPFGDVPAPSLVGVPQAESVTFATRDGLTLQGWFIEPRAAPRSVRGATAASRTTVLVFNGNAGNRAYRAPLADAFNAHGCAVLLFDYRGFGGNPGSPTEAGLRLDARAAAAYVRGRADVDASRLVYFGESLGAAVAVDLAVDDPPAALALRSPFTSMTDVAAVHYPLLPVRALLRDRYDAVARARHLRVPTLVIAGDGDRIVPIEQSRRLYEALPEPAAFVLIEGADHNDAALTAGKQMMDEVAAFLDRVLPQAE